MRILELGSYIVPAYAGMVLAEQGHRVVKWTLPPDPIQKLIQGDELWAWINHNKILEERHVRDILDLAGHEWPDVIIDNIRPSTLAKWGVDPGKLAEEMHVPWISMRSEVGEVSFDLLAQCRSWMEYGEYVPIYVADTSGGLWMAFKALSMRERGEIGHVVLGQASCMQKLVEGELAVKPEQPRWKRTAWDSPGSYWFDPYKDEGVVFFRGNTYKEPVRDAEWKWNHLWHKDGRIRI